MKLNRLHTTLRKEFRNLPEPESLDPLRGDFTARYVGHAPVRMSGPLFMTTLRFRGWTGKRFAGNAEELAGSNRFGDGDPSADRYPMRALVEPSIIDGRDAFVVHYPPDTPKPWNRARDEFREFEDGRLLGITTFDFPVVRHLPLAFVLERD